MVFGSSLPFALCPLDFRLLARTAHCPRSISLSSTPDGRARLLEVRRRWSMALPSRVDPGTRNILFL
ncbi:hypothetical protein BO94DRAFT_487264 [Aspergillus sclerotioniger CBS 115572]|uniref:Uncharacterized protein n=1 Tax=Aspergillus sclerotioniger CBS 115572 TaxID=1450535 RepID=A0A317X885_9EURO|nr:hypothetical protein BO94DRAFT_487264 [Aspergillus sclerotioniger CBS 115572]PWY93787.1 hypothetical protein BO94DRAFT_487264 [Aspergillus sclerotioniger CBS 115572]